LRHISRNNHFGVHPHAGEEHFDLKTERMEKAAADKSQKTI